MFNKILKTTLPALCGAFMIFIASGTAQASVADGKLIAQDIETVNAASFFKGNYKHIPRETLRQRKERLEAERDRGRHYRDDRRDRYYRYDRRDRHDDYKRPAPPSKNGNWPPPPPR